MGNYTIFKCSKILGEAGKQEILQQMLRNSRSQIVFRTDIFQKLTLDAPDKYSLSLQNVMTELPRTQTSLACHSRFALDSVRKPKRLLLLPHQTKTAVPN